MEKIKQYWREILIGLLVIFGLNKCTTSCTNGQKYNKSEEEKKTIIAQKDSIISGLNDSIRSLNTTIQVYNEKVAGLNQSLQIQEEASKRISEAKKNISVNVRQTK